MKALPYSLPFLPAVVLIAALGGASPDVSADSSLFATHEPLAMELIVDMKSLCRAADASKCEDTPAILVHHRIDAEPQRIGILVRTRGEWRRARKNCRMPPLFLLFSETTTRGTVFEKHTMLPLTTHCRPRKRNYEQYLLKEYLGYRIYNLLSEKSLRVRLVQMTFRDTSRKSRAVTRYAFLTEHFQSLAARHGAEVWRPARLDPRHPDPIELGVLSLYQYMIGNTDWSLVYRHNIMATRTPDGAVTPVPFDLDFSGLVNAAYAGPPPKLPIRSVRQRLFRGFCRADINWDHVFGHFDQRRSSVLELVAQTPGLTPKNQQDSIAFLEKFYQVLASDKQRRKRITDACRPLPAAVVALN